MRYLIRFAVAVALLLLVTPVLAQGQVLITDPGGRLDQNAIRQTARPLLNKGATVAVYFVDNGDGDDFTERLVDDGLARADGAFLTNVIAIYVALNDRYSDIRFGDQWAEALAVNENYEFIRSTVLNPGLSSGDFTSAFSDTLGAINEAIENPPVPGGGVNLDPTPIVLGVSGLAAAGVGGFIVVNRRRTAKSRSDAQQRLKDAREGVGALIADFGLRFKNVEEKARYDAVSYAPEAIARLKEQQQRATATFVQVQGRFKEIGEQLDRHEKPSNEQLLQAATAYDLLRTDAQAVVEQLGAVEQLRAKLDEEARSAHEELDRAKKA